MIYPHAPPSPECPRDLPMSCCIPHMMKSSPYIMSIHYLDFMSENSSYERKGRLICKSTVYSGQFMSSAHCQCPWVGPWTPCSVSWISSAQKKNVVPQLTGVQSFDCNMKIEREREIFFSLNLEDTRHADTMNVRTVVDNPRKIKCK